MIIPTSIAAYRRADFPELRLANTYAEAAVSTPGAVVLLPRPGMEVTRTLGVAGPVRGLFQQPGFFGGNTFAVAANSLFRGGVNVGMTNVSAQAQMVAAANALLIAGDAFYRYDGSTVSTVAFPDAAAVTSVVYLGGYAIAARAGSRRFYFTLDSATWDGLDYLSAEQSTDPIVGLAVVVDQLWVFCERHIEIFFLTGDADAPLQRVQGRVFDKGALTRDSIVNLDNTVFWVGDDGIVYRGEGTPIRVSDHGIEERIADSASAIAWSYAWKGHLFYVLHLNAETLVYDVATKQWHQAASRGHVRWRGRYGVQAGRDVIVADDVDGTLWRLTDAAFTDGGDEIERVFTVLINERVFVDDLVAVSSSGEVGNPNAAPGIMELRTSRDRGRTWTEWRQKEMGAQGRFRTTVGFNRIGLVDRSGLVIEWRITDPRPSTISEVRLNETRAGRSR